MTALGDEEALRTRWAQLGLNDGAVVFSEFNWSREPPLWFVFFERATELARTQTADLHPFLPFLGLVQPFVRAAVEQLNAAIGPAAAPGALDNAILHLQRRLSRMAARCFLLEFRALHAAALTGVNRLGADRSDNALRTFTNDALSPAGWNSIFETYPTLARQLSRVAMQSAQSLISLFCDLADDRAALAQEFAVSTDDAAIGVEVGLSDPHGDGRSVCLVHFAGGKSVYYKPRPLDMEAMLGDVFRILAPDIETRPDALPRIVARCEHGWMSPVQNDALARANAESYYRRFGEMSALTHALCGTDLHFENVVASGDQPVIVDAETFLYPQMTRLEELKAGKACSLATDEYVMKSVLGIGALPKWEVAEGRAFDLSAGGATTGATLPGASFNWENTDCDRIAVRRGPLTQPNGKSVPVSESGEEIGIASYGDAVGAGFRNGAAAVSKHRATLSQLLNDHNAEGLRGRFLLRHTNTYAALLQRLHHPRFMGDAIDRSIELETLAKPFARLPALKLHKAILHAELAALQDETVPKFDTVFSSRSVWLNKSELSTDFFSRSGSECIAERLFSQADTLEREVQLIQASLSARRTRPHDDMTAAHKSSFVPVTSLDKNFHQSAIAHATAIGDTLARAAIRADDDSATWLGFTFDFASQRYGFSPLKLGLYDGASGISIFFAGLARQTGRQDFRNMALAGLASARMAIQRETLVGDIGCSLATGAAGICLALSVCAELLDEKQLSGDAAHLMTSALSITAAEASATDLLGGALGLLGAGARLLRDDEDSGLRARLVSLADKLSAEAALAMRKAEANTSFAHGLCGTLAALSCFPSSKSDDVRHDVLNWFEHWLDTPANKPDYHWCSGETGAIQALLAAPTHDHARLAARVRALAQAPSHRFHHVCCGNLGRAETIADAGLALGSTELLTEAQTAGHKILTTIQDTKRWGLPMGEVTDTFNPGFFQGLSGIGYSLLRLTNPALFPSVLSLGVR